MDAKPFVHKLLKPDGSVVDYPPKAKQYSLQELQEAVGGYIEIVPLGRGQHLMVVNEEGKLHGLPKNQLASDLYDSEALYVSHLDYIVGNALVCRNGDID